MPATRFAPFLLAVAAAGVASPAAAQRGHLVIENVRVGMPPGRFTAEREDNATAAYLVKKDTWAPVYFSLKVEGELPQRAQNARLFVEAADSDDLRTSITYPLGNFAARTPGELIPFGELASTPFVRFGDRNNGDVTFTVIDANGSKLSDSVRLSYLRTREPSSYVVLSLGSKLPGFDLPKENRNANFQPNVIRGGRVETATMTTLAELPDQWFGYAAADLIVLTTGSASNDFLTGLFGRETTPEAKAKLAALVEWVRRGGRLVVSVAGNAQLLTQYPAFQQLLPAKLSDNPAADTTNNLRLSWKIRGTSSVFTESLSQRDKPPFPVAKLVFDPARPARTLIPPAGDDDPAVDVPAVVQAPFGLGRVTAVTFDLDRSPFTEYSLKAEFWDWLLREAGAEKASVGGGRTGENNWNPNKEDEYITALRTHVDTFDGVPVISFGWVALFIALYTLLIGPVEYLFLKKIVGRLELTWITFPIIVLSVSAAAYFTAYAIKGNDLKINKLDVVDVDPASGRVFGRTWFTVFSPRIDTYTVGVEPRKEWSEKAATPPLVDWMAGGQSGGGNIISRGYTYHTDATASPRLSADGLVGVPIQVWSTKAFAANWSAALDPAAPLVESRLYHPAGDRTALRGDFVNNLPVKQLRGAVLIYAGRAYKLGTLVPGQKVAAVTDKSADDAEWFTRELGLAAVAPEVDNNPWGRNTRTPTPVPTASAVAAWGLLFHEAAIRGADRAPMNASLRSLDQSWRLAPDFRDQAILLAKVDGTTTPGVQNAEELLTDPTGPSPSVLWLRGVPSGGDPRASVPGTLRQETYIRVYLPVAAKQPGAK